MDTKHLPRKRSSFLSIPARLGIALVILTVLLAATALPALADGPGGVGDDLEWWAKADADVFSDAACLTPANNNDTVRCWADQTGGTSTSLDLKQEGTQALPTFKTNQINGNPSVSFAVDGSMVFSGGGNFNTTPFSYIVVWKRTVAMGNHRILISGGSTYSYLQYGNLWYVSGGTQQSIPMANDTFFIKEVTMSAARLAERYTDGMTHGTQNAGSSFGCNGLGGASWNITNGDIAETIYYSDDLNDAERIIVENYLSAKYDIALTANDVYTGDEAINGDYDWGVAGIGQITGTSQAVTSHTVASSAGLVISDTGFLQNNGDFVMFGYTTTVNSWVHTDLPAGVVRRWERDWYLDITDVVTQGGGVDIAFDFSAGGIGDTPGGAYALLERDSASGDFSVVTTTHTISGSQVIFHLDASDLEDDHYYTLGAGITKAVNDPIPNPGEMITYTITVGNSDAFAYTDAVISDTLPVSLTFANNVVIDPPQPGAVVATTAADLPTLVSNLTIASGERVTVTFNAIVTSTVTGGMLITNTAAVTSTQVVTPQRASVGLSINYAPVATATVDSAYINLCDTTTLRGNTSDDPDGHLPLSYHWKQTGGPGVDGIANPFTHTTIFTGSCSAEGVITFTLTVTDSLDLADPTPDIVTVTVKNVPVDGLSVANSSTTTLGCTTYFTAEITDGSSVTYTWDFGDGTAPIVTTDSAHKSYAGHIYAPACVTTPITYTVVVTAQNGFITGTPPVYTTYTDTTTTIVTITNEAPVAVAGVAPPVDRHQQAVVDSLVTLDASDSYDPDAASCGSNDITEYHWEWTGGIVSVTLSDNSAISPTFTAPSPPTLPTVISFTLTVTDTGCLSATDLISITLVPTVGGHTAPVETSALLWPWVALVAVLGAMAAVVATALRRRTAHREFP